MSDNKPYESLLDDYVFTVPELPMNEVMLGLSLIGQSFKDATVMALLITKRRNWAQAVVARACLWRNQSKIVETEEDDKKTWEEFERLQQFLRNMVNRAVNEEIEAENRALREQKKRLEEELRSQLKQTHQPSLHGTVKEIASKYGISLSEVRRMKADGTLDDYIRSKA